MIALTPKTLHDAVSKTCSIEKPKMVKQHKPQKQNHVKTPLRKNRTHVMNVSILTCRNYVLFFFSEEKTFLMLDQKISTQNRPRVKTDASSCANDLLESVFFDLRQSNPKLLTPIKLSLLSV